jgi:hypothetical protein
MTKSQNRNSGSREIPIKVVGESSLTDELRQQRIAEKAHEIYECRGCCHGRDLDDWLEAERLVLSEIASQAHGTAQNPRGRARRSQKG